MTRILIVDDHEVVCSGLRMILESQPGWLVVGEASNGREAIDKAVETKPDVVILDYALPIMNGIETTRQIRRRVPQTEVLILTMHESDELIRSTLQAGARGYLLKSDARRLLVSTVEAVANHKFFFTSKVSQTLLDAFLTTTKAEGGPLTARERAVVQLIAEGMSNKQIASVLCISPKTVETHRASAMHKLDMPSTAALVRYAIRNKIIEA